FKYKNGTIAADNLTIGYDFLKTMDLKLVAGRDFSRQYATDSVIAVLINEQMALQIGKNNPVGEMLDINESGKPFQVIGVIKDFHFESLHNKIGSHMIMLGNKNFSPGYIFVKVSDKNTPETMELLEKTWLKAAPGLEFKGSFINENADRQYNDEKQIAGIFTGAAGLSILLSCMGLFAIAVLTITQRTKEIGIRKVLGASVNQIVMILSKDFLKLVLIAFVIAVPVAWYAMNQWLQDFAYRIEISWWIFALAGISALLIALFTVSFQAIRAALANPVKSLRTE
ncbi:MAG: FtsX-like permease family protein, partial [Verrucomicrobia bacterium]|nr:FtsX-like permease family protein [Cytophagales bacterium]